MLAESLVIFACLNKTGCTETAVTYNQYYPELKELVIKNEKKLKNYIGPYALETAGPFLLVLFKGTADIKLHKNVHIQMNQNSNKLIFNKDF